MDKRSIRKIFFLFFFGFVIPRIIFATTITSSPETVSVSATVGGGSANPLGGGGGGSPNTFPTSVVLSGYAYPEAIVHIWKDGAPKAITNADAKGYFSATLDETYNPSALYTLYAFDMAQRRSLLLNYTIVIKNNYITQLSGIRFTPTIAIDKTEVKIGDYLTIGGYALPNEPLDISIEGSRNQTFYLTSGIDGIYKLTVPLLDLQKGDYSLHVNYHADNKISRIIKFTIGDMNIKSTELVTNIPGDSNGDQVINLLDFSVMAFWYGKGNFPKSVDVNGDNVINLVDFSILAFYWTG